jgi:phosphomethylpyrimidine synthase
VAFKIAAHIGDTLKYGPRPEDKDLARYRRERDWEGQFIAAIDGDRRKRSIIRIKQRPAPCVGSTAQYSSWKVI